MFSVAKLGAAKARPQPEHQGGSKRSEDRHGVSPRQAPPAASRKPHEAPAAWAPNGPARPGRCRTCRWAQRARTGARRRPVRPTSRSRRSPRPPARRPPARTTSADARRAARAAAARQAGYGPLAPAQAPRLGRDRCRASAPPRHRAGRGFARAWVASAPGGLRRRKARFRSPIDDAAARSSRAIPFMQVVTRTLPAWPDRTLVAPLARFGARYGALLRALGTALAPHAAPTTALVL